MRAEILMVKIGRGDERAFVELMEAWESDLMRFFRLLGADAHEAEDYLQETFLRLFAYRRRYRARPGIRFEAFLFRIARNVFVDGLRRKNRNPTCVRLGEGCQSEPNEDPALLWGDCIDLHQALLSLSSIHRLVVFLNVFEGLTYKEVSAVLQVPVGTVKSRMYHALLRLREVLGVKSKSRP